MKKTVTKKRLFRLFLYVGVILLLRGWGFAVTDYTILEPNEALAFLGTIVSILAFVELMVVLLEADDLPPCDDEK